MPWRAVFYIPTFSSDFGTNNLSVFVALTKNGNLEYATGLAEPWNAVTYKDNGETATCSAKEWIRIDQVYTSTGTTGERKLGMWINGREVNITFADRSQINCVSMILRKDMNNQVVYIDNMSMTETELEPMDCPDITNNFSAPTTGVSFVDANGQAIDTVSVAAGTANTLNLAFTPADAADKAVTFTSSNKSVADFDADGKLVAYQNGTTTVTVKLNSNETITDQLTVTASAPMGKLPITEDFQDETAGLRNPFGLVGDPSGVATVFEKDGNKMLQVSNSSTLDHAQVFMSFRKNAGVYYKDSVYLSYWLLVSGTGRFYIPSLGFMTNSPSLAVYIAITNGAMEYATSLNGARTAVKYKDTGDTVTYTDKQWILVEQTYTSTGTTGERKMSMSINGRKMCRVRSLFPDKWVPGTSISMNSQPGTTWQVKTIVWEIVRFMTWGVAVFCCPEATARP